jgi:hypothetical protein
VLYWSARPFSHAATEHRLLGGGIGGGSLVRAAPRLPQRAIKAHRFDNSSLTATRSNVWGVGCGSDQRRSMLANRGGQAARDAPRPTEGAERPASQEGGPVEAWSGLDQNSVWLVGKPGPAA